MFTKKVEAQNAMETTGQNYLQCNKTTTRVSFKYTLNIARQREGQRGTARERQGKTDKERLRQGVIN